jgi:hypothetical protein
MSSKLTAARVDELVKWLDAVLINRGWSEAASQCPVWGPLAKSAKGSKRVEHVVGVGGSGPTQSAFAVLAHLADMVLGVKFKAKLGDEVELGFEEIDVVLLVRHQLFEQVARHIIPG